MSIDHTACVLLGCDDCEDPWEEDIGTPHFETEAKAIDFALRNDWVIVGESMRCGRCATKADCAMTGHQYDEWMSKAAPVPYRSRWCEHCNTTDYDPPFEQLSLLMHAARELEGNARA